MVQRTWTYRLNLEPQLRKRGWTRYELAKQSGVAWNTIWRASLGTQKQITFDLLWKLCNVLECTPNDVLVEIEVKLKEDRQRPARKGKT